MRSGAATNPFNLMRKGLTLLMAIGMSSAQETPLSEIFFLDLGIVIEPTNGSETYSRVVNKPSKEVAFKRISRGKWGLKGGKVRQWFRAM